MIEGLHVVLLFMLDQILCHGIQGSNPTVFRSSTEAEYKSLTNATSKVIWVQTLLDESRVSQSKAVVL
jgi:hypothetical protein